MTGPELGEVEPDRSPRPRIYVASLSDYNDGRLHGAWIRADQAPDIVASEVEAMLRASPIPRAEESAIHDYEGFTGWRLHEHESLETVVRVAHGIAEHGPAFGHWAGYVDGDMEHLDRFMDAYRGEYDSATAYAEYLMEEIGLSIHVEPSNWEPYVNFDAEAFGRDLAIEMHMPESENGVYIFDPYVL